jgi:uncharacterized protein YodC (DUF2158 family)
MAPREPVIGEVVYHKAGGPKMVIKHIDPRDSGIRYFCQYYNAMDGRFVQDAFRLEELIISDKPEEDK